MAELIAPGVFLLFVGAAAMITGLFVLMLSTFLGLDIIRRVSRLLRQSIAYALAIPINVSPFRTRCSTGRPSP